MSDVRTGRAFRAIRRRMNLRQSDVAARAGVSQQVVSQLERGMLGPSSVAVVRRVAEALGASVSIAVSWRGPALDRLLDEQHAALVAAASRLLSVAGWEIALEASYSEWGERGSIDVLAFHPVTGTLIVVEVKTRIAAVEETLRKHDEKARLAPSVARRRFGWEAVYVRRLLVLPDDSTARRQVARHEEVFARAYPLRGQAAKVALGSPLPAAPRASPPSPARRTPLAPSGPRLAAELGSPPAPIASAHPFAPTLGPPLAPTPPLAPAPPPAPGDMLLFLASTDGGSTRRSSVTPERVSRKLERPVRGRPPGPRPAPSTDRAVEGLRSAPEARAHRVQAPRPGPGRT